MSTRAASKGGVPRRVPTPNDDADYGRDDGHSDSYTEYDNSPEGNDFDITPPMAVAMNTDDASEHESNAAPVVQTPDAQEMTVSNRRTLAEGVSAVLGTAAARHLDLADEEAANFHVNIALTEFIPGGIGRFLAKLSLLHQVDNFGSWYGGCRWLVVAIWWFIIAFQWIVTIVECVYLVRYPELVVNYSVVTLLAPLQYIVAVRMLNKDAADLYTILCGDRRIKKAIRSAGASLVTAVYQLPFVYCFFGSLWMFHLLGYYEINIPAWSGWVLTALIYADVLLAGVVQGLVGFIYGLGQSAVGLHVDAYIADLRLGKLTLEQAIRRHSQLKTMVMTWTRLYDRNARLNLFMLQLGLVINVYNYFTATKPHWFFILAAVWGWFNAAFTVTPGVLGLNSKLEQVEVAANALRNKVDKEIDGEKVTISLNAHEVEELVDYVHRERVRQRLLGFNIDDTTVIKYFYHYFVGVGVLIILNKVVGPPNELYKL